MAGHHRRSCGDCESLLGSVQHIYLQTRPADEHLDDLDDLDDNRDLEIHLRQLSQHVPKGLKVGPKSDVAARYGEKLRYKKASRRKLSGRNRDYYTQFAAAC